MKRASILLALACVCAVTVGRADTSVVFNEIMYHPHTNEAALEWVELRNQMAVDVDISGWSLDGGIQYTFASNTIVRGGGLIVVAVSPAALIDVTSATNVLGPFTGRLANGGEDLLLRNNSGRVVDEVIYGVEGDWPVAADGAGVSLAKRDREGASGPAENWTTSDQIGGTPGAENFPGADAVPTDTLLLAVDASWKYEASGTDLGTTWRGLAYDDSSWSSRPPFTNRAIPNLFNTGVGVNGVALAAGANDPHYILSAGAQGTVGAPALVILNHPAWLANDAVSSFIGVVNPGATSIAGGGYNFQTTFSLAGFIASTARININVAVDNVLSDVFLNGAGSGLGTSGFAAFNPPLTLASGFVPGVNTLEFRTLNEGAGPGGFRATVSGTALAVNTNAPLPLGPTTYYFRRTFTLSSNPAYTELRLNPIIADGAVVYLNGVEVFRQNMPGGPVTYATAASFDVPAPGYSGLVQIPSGSLVAGANVLAVEVHPAAGSGDAPLFGADMIATALPVPPTPPFALAFNEFSASTNAEFWLELVNHGSTALSLEGCVIVRDGLVSSEYAFPAGAPLAPGGYLAITNTTLGFHPESGDKLYLLPPDRSKVLDSVVVKKVPRGRSAGGTGPYLFPDSSTPGAPNSFAFRNEIVINEIMYHPRELPPTNGPAVSSARATWIELHNKSANAVDLTGWALDGGIGFQFLGQSIAAGGYLVVAKDAVYLQSLYPAAPIVGNFSQDLSHKSDLIVLRDPTGNPADQVQYFDDGRWPGLADGGGSSLELRDPNADNSKAETWAASDETDKTSWQTYTYRMVAAIPSGSGQPTTWTDFILGLLGGGECLLDDLTVIETPATTPVQMVANGNFENGLTGWRVIGTHGGSRVETEPGNPGNHVLHLIASGPQEHMHNHIEATTIAYRPIVSGREYQISYRAKWLAGNNLLNTRLYFNRCARTTALPVPALNGTPGGPNSSLVANIGPTFSEFGHERVIPQPNEPVTVTVVAEDPQSVSSCDVWWSVNSGAFLSAAMTPQGGGRYQGTIPGSAAGSIVQFYVRAVDGLGAAAAYPAGGTNSGALYMVADGQANFALGHNVRIILTPANRDLLHALTNVMSNVGLPGTVIYNEKRAYYDVGVRLKGSERGRYSDTRVSFHLTFPTDDLFRGVHPVMLVDRSGAGDSTSNKQQEILIKHILLRAGHIPTTQPDLCRVIAPRSAHTGPAIFLPRIEDQFVETAIPNGGDGTMWELELIYYPTSTNQFGYKLPQPDAVVGTDISNLGDDKEIYRYNFILKNHRDADDYSRFIAFAKSVSLTGAALDAQTRQTMGLDEWMRVWAGVSLCGVGDTYTFGNNHNLFMYSRPSDGKVVPFPADMDFSFNRAATSTLVGDQNISRVINLPSNLRCFYGHVLDLIGSSYNTSYMNYWVSHYRGFVPGQDYSAVLSYITQRTTAAMTEINNAGGNAPFNITGTNFITTSNNLVTISGTAPVRVKTIKINGVEYPVTWTTVSGWTIRIPVSAPTNELTLVGYDLHGAALTNFTRNVTVHYTGPLPSPEGALVINEIMYNPALPEASYVEIFNTAGSHSFELSNWEFNGLGYTFPPGSLITNRQFLVLAKNRTAFAAAYGTAIPVFAEFDGQLDDGGETLSLIKPGATPAEDLVVDRVTYDDDLPWLASADGHGPSLQLIDAAQDNNRVSNWSDGAGWRFFSFTGSPGNFTSARLSLFFEASGGDAYLDDMAFVLGPTPGAGTNHIANGDFEATLSPPWFKTGVGTNSAITTAVARSGNASLHLVMNPGAQSLTAFYQDLLPIMSNSTYTLSFWYLSGSSGTNLNARINTLFRPSLFARPVQFTPGTTNSTTAPLPAYPPLWLSEVQPNNLSGITDNFGETEPWIELYNSGAEALDLAGYYLADNYTNLTAWPFPPGAVLNPGQRAVIWADGESGETAGLQWHTGFRLNPTNGAVVLARLVEGAPQVLDYLNYQDVGTNRSYGSFPDGQLSFRQAFHNPTPGGLNNPAGAPPVVFINEWMAANTGVLRDPADDDLDDWFEIYNPGPNTADLAGYYLTDNLANRFQYRIPAGYTIPPGGFLLVWADEETAQNSTNRADLHVNFRLSQFGEAIGLFAANGTQIDAITFVSQTNNVSQGHYPDGSGPVYWMTTPTPRTANVISGTSVPPQFSGVAIVSEGVVQFSFSTAPGRTYRVEYTDNLIPPAWTPLGADQVAGGNSLTINDAIGAGTQRFYRVLLLD